MDSGEGGRPPLLAAHRAIQSVAGGASSGVPETPRRSAHAIPGGKARSALSWVCQPKQSNSDELLEVRELSVEHRNTSARELVGTASLLGR